ncbi:hypothetical protein K470DRAFT_199211, partial [Piedraia hortae CBS 480.64]
SPQAPAFSPITPKAQPTCPAQNVPEVGSLTPPAPLPFSSESNPDAIALRAAISALQYQRQQAQKDLKTLEEIKFRALNDPGHFKDELIRGRVRESQPSFGLDFQALNQGATPAESTTSFANIPGPQNIVRMPYVNWDKYHIVGEGLDRLHEEQRRAPSGTQFNVAAPYNPLTDTI